MGLMDKPKQKFNEEYVSITNFILYIAFIKREPVEDVVSWLLYNWFEKDIASYHVDKHYRVFQGRQKKGIDLNIRNLFNQISIDGYHAYYAYQRFIEDEEESMAEYCMADLYSEVNEYFYLYLPDLEELDYLKDLNLNFREASEFDYCIFMCDRVTAKYRFENKKVSLFRFNPNTLKEEMKLQPTDVGIYTKPKATNFLKPAFFENLKTMFEQIASGEFVPNENQKADENKNENEVIETSSSRAQDRKVIAVLALLLANRSKFFKVGERPNATQISKAIYELAIDDLKIADEDLTGLKATTDKISKAIQEYSDILYKKPED